MKTRASPWFTAVATSLALTAACGPGAPEVPRIERLSNNPIIRPELLPDTDGANINGPSLIRVPEWLENPLGKYYLYFAHHAGTYIRLAYADELEGPWTIHEPGTLQLEGTVCNDISETHWATYRHVASPDVHVDDESRRIRMYFHCPAYIDGPRNDETSYQQVSLVATSRDGLAFSARSEALGTSYFRVFEWGGYQYAIGMPGNIYRSENGLSGFEKGPTLFSEDMRHAAVKVSDGQLLVFYTDVGDEPERILLSRIDLGGDWMKWKASEPRVVLEPKEGWEGAGLPLEPSVRGAAVTPVRQLRDPALFEDANVDYLLYSVAGEHGIAIGRIHW